MFNLRIKRCNKIKNNNKITKIIFLVFEMLKNLKVLTNMSNPTLFTFFIENKILFLHFYFNYLTMFLISFLIYKL